MNLRRALLNRILRWTARPSMAHARDPVAERRKFDFGAQFFRRPADLLLLDGDLPRVTCHPTRATPVILYFHGGAYVTGGPATHLTITGRLARLTGMTVYAARYPLAPEHPAPAAFEAAVAIHARLLRLYRPDQIILGGDSAGGGLALALLAHLCQTDQRPAGLFAFSPWTDLTLGGDSLRLNAQTDVILPAHRVREAAALVRGALAPDDPRISPLFAAFPDPPPVLIQVGTTEVLRDDGRRMAAVLGARLTEWQDCPHVWQMFDGFLPEARAALRETADFIAHLAERTVR